MVSEEEECVYIIDANIFMQAARTYYSFDLAPRFWDALIEWAEQGRIVSIDKVFQEIKDGREDDPLVEWAKEYFCNYFDTTQTSEIVLSYADLTKWAQNHPTYLQKAKDIFMEDDVADAWIIAFAKVRGCVVVTSEIHSDAIARIPIPNVCEAFDIRCIDTFQMLKELGFNF